MKLASALILLALLVATATAALIYSNTVTVNVKEEEYHLTLAPASQNVTLNHYANFTATLKLGDTPVSGATITLFYGNGTTTGTSNVTIADGTCKLRWNATKVGSVTFKAGYETP